MKSLVRVHSKIWFYRFWGIAAILLGNNVVDGQLLTDSLCEVQVQAFAYQQGLLQTPAAIAKITQQQLNNTHPLGLLPAVNMVAGVKMEERSPNSYRLSIRGSSLRSPFGVRNVKVYWNDIPFSDAGGNTYLNLLDASHLTEVEIVKGPAASMYGAGTGGVVFFTTALPNFTANEKYHIKATIGGGSFGNLQQSLQWYQKTGHRTWGILQSLHQSNGYRQQSASQKQNLQLHLGYQKERHQLQTICLFSHLYYQTPGGLTYAQMMQQPQQARPATVVFPSAQTQKAAIDNLTLWTGTAYSYNISKVSKWSTSIVLNNTAINNPFITNYEKRNEWNVGVRTQLLLHHYQGKSAYQLVFGAEYLNNWSRIQNYGNKAGNADTLQFNDKVKAVQNSVFVQAQWQKGSWQMQAGVSYNQQGYNYRRLPNQTTASTNQAGVVAPRVVFAYQANKAMHLYLLCAKGYSPPSLAEVRPSDGNFYADLQPENGWNTELGIKGQLGKTNQWLYDVSLYYLMLNQAIVRRNYTASEYFVNAGKIRQSGMEIAVEYRKMYRNSRVLKQVIWTNSAAFQPYRFVAYQIRANNYNGNAVTGIPTYTNNTTLQLHTKGQWQYSIAYNYTSEIPLTDANDYTASNYHLVQLKINKKWLLLNKYNCQGYLGVDNLLNQLYSLGNDINAAGLRFYNPAPKRNFFAGIVWQIP